MCIRDSRYIIAPRGVSAGMQLISGSEAPIKVGNAMPLRNIPVGSTIHCIELQPGKGAQIARSAGTSVQLLAREGAYAQLRLRSGEVRRVHVDCMATLGEVGNEEHSLRSIGKAGAMRWRCLLYTSIMSLGLIGRKVGMTRVFTEDGASIPVTVLEVVPNRVTQIKTIASDGYTGLQVAYGERRASRINKALTGHYAKSGSAAGAGIQEFSVTGDVLANYAAGASITVDIFQAGQMVDVTGTSLGKGFAGAIKRHHFSSNRASHGNSRSHNVPGSIGMAQDPGRVFPGKRMPGHLGAVKVTTQNLEIVRVDAERNLLSVSYTHLDVYKRQVLPLIRPT